MVGVTYVCVVARGIFVVSYEEILKCMMIQNWSSVKTSVKLMFTDIKNEGFTPRNHGTYEKFGIFT